MGRKPKNNTNTETAIEIVDNKNEIVSEVNSSDVLNTNKDLKITIPETKNESVNANLKKIAKEEQLEITKNTLKELNSKIEECCGLILNAYASGTRVHPLEYYKVINNIICDYYYNQDKFIKTVVGNLVYIRDNVRSLYDQRYPINAVTLGNDLKRIILDINNFLKI